MKSLISNDERMMGIGVGKKLLKIYQGLNVYLNDKDEFQIMLFNPTNSKIAAKISINGERIPNMVVLRPGERIWLDRYLHKNAKFIFSTYTVDDTPQISEIIKDNGIVKVEFYKEEKPKNYIICDSYSYPSNIDIWNSNISTVPNSITWQSNQFASHSLSDTITTSCYNAVNTSISTIETGRIEEGSRSEQEFDYDNSEFSRISFQTETIKLLPMSQKPMYKNDIQKRYCTKCGKKLKQNYNYCPVCGNKVK